MLLLLPVFEGGPAHLAGGRRVDLLGRRHSLVRRLHVQPEALPRQQPLAAPVAEVVEAAGVAACGGLVPPVDLEVLLAAGKLGGQIL